MIVADIVKGISCARLDSAVDTGVGEQSVGKCSRDNARGPVVGGYGTLSRQDACAPTGSPAQSRIKNQGASERWTRSIVTDLPSPIVMAIRFSSMSGPRRILENRSYQAAFETSWSNANDAVSMAIAAEFMTAARRTAS